MWQSGQDNVYVQPFNGGSTPGGGNSQVSISGGSHPAWRADAKELFYLSQERVLMAVAVKPGVTFNYDRPVALF